MSAVRDSPVLWIPASGAAVSGVTLLLGLPLARRVALAGRRAGFSRMLFEDDDGGGGGETGALARSLAGTGAEIVPQGAPAPAGSVAVPPGGLPQVSWLRERLAESAESGTADAPRAASDQNLFVLRGPADMAAAERWLLRGLVKDSEGFMSRHVERRISLAISRRLAATAVTPNAMTIVSVGVGLVGAAFFLSPRASMQFAGALLFLLHSILDGCDGELARLKFQESRFGGVLDFWGDNLVHVAVFACLAVGWSKTSGETLALVAGLAAIAGTVLSAAFVYRRTMAEPKDGPQFTSVTVAPPTRLSRLADALAQRDFIYLVVLLAAFGKANWFLALAAVGSPLFFLALVVVDVSGRRIGRSFL